MKVAATIFALLAASGCQRAAPAPAPKPSASAPSLTNAPAASSSASSASAVAPALASAAPRAQTPAEAVLANWNTALDRRNADALVPLYAPRVYFYGQWKSAAQVVSLKRSAFLKQPDFRQHIDQVHITKTDRGFVAIFQKHSGAGAAASVEARLTLESTAGKFLIAEESDSITDDKLKQPPPSNCLDAALQIVSEQPAIQADMRRVAHEFPEANPGGITYEEDAHHLSAAYGYFLPERFDTRWRIEVENGVLALTDAYTDALFPLTTEQRARVRSACSAE
jgi:hypothetical protein